MVLATLSTTAVLVACSKSPADKAKEAAETIKSWNATVAAVDGARRRGHVPGHFARDVHRAAAEAIARAKQSQ
jgi:hypothetical protein